MTLGSLIFIIVITILPFIIAYKIFTKKVTKRLLYPRCANCKYSKYTYYRTADGEQTILLSCSYKSKTTDADNICKYYLSKI